KNSFSFSVLGHVCRGLGLLPEARVHFHRAIQLSVDNANAIQCLLELAGTGMGREDEIGFVGRGVGRQGVRGGGLLTFLELARPLLEPEKLLSILREAKSERPDLWHAWSALVSQLGHLGHHDQAIDFAREATRKFPHLARTWLDLAMVHQWRNEPVEAIR